MKKKSFIFLFLILFSKVSISCPSSGDGDCVPKTNKPKENNYKENTSKNSNQTNNSDNNFEDGWDTNDFIIKEGNYLKSINNKSKLNFKIKKINLDIQNLTYESLNQYSSNYSYEINKNLLKISDLVRENQDVNEEVFFSINKNINKLFDAIIYPHRETNFYYFNKNKQLSNKLQINNKINEYNEINDIIKTLEILK